jgi:hypothetical protein
VRPPWELAQSRTVRWKLEILHGGRAGAILVSRPIVSTSKALSPNNGTHDRMSHGT